MQYRVGDQVPDEPGALELGWADGRFTTLDARADWTLDVSFQAWDDPFNSATADERRRLAQEVGLWESALLSADLREVIGRTVTAVEPLLNEIGELTGLEIAFGELLVVARIQSGSLDVRTSRR